MTREWLETNGIGGFASSTVTGRNTRRYHGLLVAATKPPLGRKVLLSKLDETLIVGDRRIELACNRYPGVIHPRGDLYLKTFRNDPFPTFIYEVDRVELTKTVFMVHGENTTVIEYSWTGSAMLELRPLIAFRDYHATAHENGAINGDIEVMPGLVKCSPYQGCPDLYVAHSTAEVQRAGDWYRNFEYDVEQERGLDYREDLFHPFTLKFADSATILASIEPKVVENTAKLRVFELERRRSVAGTAPADDPFAVALTRAADQFLVARGEGSTVIAGYHWFSDWGRDTMIALPGLTLATGRYGEARQILRAFAASVDRGMLPNRFPDAGETPEYNTVDATLWFFEAVRAYHEHTGARAFVDEILPVLADIIEWHQRGTRYGIRVDADGLLLAGEPGVQLTWMDAKIGDWVVTPRHGKPVEIQALWYNALRIMEEFTGDLRYCAMAARARESFRAQFWCESTGCLYDVPGDASIRPNQIFAASLPHSMLDTETARTVVDAVERHLLTPYGLRTLAPSDPHYRGRYEGGPGERDSAYHQGTVWPWLMGPFVTAYRKVYGRSPEWSSAFRQFVEEQGSGYIPEVFDGDAPHRPGGCLSQAWSVAELLRCVAAGENRSAAAGRG
jgi:predicted glycogen debranching enzyme